MKQSTGLVQKGLPELCKVLLLLGRGRRIRRHIALEGVLGGGASRASLGRGDTAMFSGGRGGPLFRLLIDGHGSGRRGIGQWYIS